MSEPKAGTCDEAARREAVRRIVADLAALRADDRLFNPYAEHDPQVEASDAPARRRENLTRVLHAMLLRPAPLLWIGEAPARRGARRSGVPFAGEAKLGELSRRLALEPPLRRVTRPEVEETNSATTREIWRAVGEGEMPLFWNAVLLHPHHGAPEMRNRRPTRAEVKQSRPVLCQLAGLFQPRATLAIGRVAERAAREAGLLPTTVRHPAQGGAAAFRQGVAHWRAALTRDPRTGMQDGSNGEDSS